MDLERRQGVGAVEASAAVRLAAVPLRLAPVETAVMLVQPEGGSGQPVAAEFALARFVTVQIALVWRIPPYATSLPEGKSCSIFITFVYYINLDTVGQ